MLADPRALEHAFGDPEDPANPVGHAAVLAADEDAQPLAAAEVLLDGYGFNAELVPAALGGRLVRLDRLVEVLRAAYRRDPALGMGYGAVSFIAAVNVWAAGGEAHRRSVAENLLDGGRVAVAYHELGHGNDLAAMRCAVRPDGGRLLLNGRKEIISNAGRARQFVVFARTDPAPGSRSHGIVLVDAAAAPADRLIRLPRYPSVGLRGVRLGGVEFRDCPLPADAFVGAPGDGVATAMSTFQVTRIVLSAAAVAVLDTGLRVTTRAATGRWLYGRPVTELAYPRALLAEVFADLLAADCLTRVAVRALHLFPAEASVLAAAVKYLVPNLLVGALDVLAGICGARFYLREGPCAMVGKLVRDLGLATIGHASAAVCQATILAQLPRLARNGWTVADPTPTELFTLTGELPPLRLDQLRLTVGGRDPLAGFLMVAPDVIAADPDGQPLVGLARQVRTALAELRKQAAGLPPRQTTHLAFPASYALADRYARLLAAAACLGVWRYDRDRADPFRAGTGWVRAVLHRLAAPGGGTLAPPLPAELAEPLAMEVVSRAHQGRGFDLLATELPA